MTPATLALVCEAAEAVTGGRTLDVLTEGAGDARTVTVATWSATERHRKVTLRAWSERGLLWQAVQRVESAHATDTTRRIERRLRSAIASLDKPAAKSDGAT